MVFHIDIKGYDLNMSRVISKVVLVHSWYNNIIMVGSIFLFVGSCLATKVFIG